ncbi:MAG: hypothetical protein H5T66_15790, partial [Chloroflexi bacterium]|nr:hypothetical protein [Chloroflexota bacterium]
MSLLFSAPLLGQLGFDRGSESEIETKRYRVNERIRARQVRVIDPDGQQLGIMGIREA